MQFIARHFSFFAKCTYFYTPWEKSNFARICTLHRALLRKWRIVLVSYSSSIPCRRNFRLVVLWILNKRLASSLIEIESFENEFKIELTQTHPIVYEWKILKLFVSGTKNDAVSYKNGFLSLLDHFVEVRNHFKLILVWLSMFMNDVEGANNLLEKIPSYQLPFLHICEWHECKIPI